MNIFANNSGNISLLNLDMNKPMAYMYNDFEGMIFNSEYNGSVFVRGGVGPAIKQTALFCIFIKWLRWVLYALPQAWYSN